jgi:hypothetical protein
MSEQRDDGLATLPLAPSWAKHVEHGDKGYDRGCKCPTCRAAHKKRMAEWRKRKAQS